MVSDVQSTLYNLQLGINDMLKLADVAVLMNLAKAAAINLRLSSYQNQLIEKDIKFKIPRMFCITRWGTEYIMVSDEVNLRLCRNRFYRLFFLISVDGFVVTQ